MRLRSLIRKVDGGERTSTDFPQVNGVSSTQGEGSRVAAPSQASVWIGLDAGKENSLRRRAGQRRGTAVQQGDHERPGRHRGPARPGRQARRPGPGHRPGGLDRPARPGRRGQAGNLPDFTPSRRPTRGPMADPRHHPRARRYPAHRDAATSTTRGKPASAGIPTPASCPDNDLQLP